MKRNIYDDLLKWKNNKNRKVLLLLGQRQVGKTYIVNQFGKNEYKKFIYINFIEGNKYAKYFDNLNGFDHLLNKLMNDFNITNDELKDTLIFLDEIQESNKALTSLKMINEAEIKLNVIASGSYLGYKIKSSSLNFPVGQVEILNMKQMMFDEFIYAIGKEKILNEVINQINKDKKIDDFYHEELLTWFNHYLIIGGMPEVVKTFINSKFSYKESSYILKMIYSSYVGDISKYSQLFQSKTFLNLIYENINSFLIKENKKFVFQELNKNLRYRELQNYLIWLDKSNLLIKVDNLKNIQFPLSIKKSFTHFKLYYNDHGFLSSSFGLENISNPLYFNNIKGGLYENFVASQFLYQFDETYYYSFIESGRKYEIDFVVQNNKGDSCLIEVKSSNSFKTTSLNRIKDHKYKYVLSPNNFEIHDNYVNIPIYLSFMMKEIVSKLNIE